MATDAAGNVYVALHNANRIQKFTSNGTYVTEWGSFGIGDGQFWYPNYVEVDATDHVFVSDAVNNRIQVFTDSGTYLYQWGSSGSGNGQFNFPVGVAIDNAGNVYISDWGNNRIQKFGSLPIPVVPTTWSAIKTLYHRKVCHARERRPP